MESDPLPQPSVFWRRSYQHARDLSMMRSAPAPSAELRATLRVSEKDRACPESDFDRCQRNFFPASGSNIRGMQGIGADNSRACRGYAGIATTKKLRPEVGSHSASSRSDGITPPRDGWEVRDDNSRLRPRRPFALAAATTIGREFNRNSADASDSQNAAEGRHRITHDQTSKAPEGPFLQVGEEKK